MELSNESWKEKLQLMNILPKENFKLWPTQMSMIKSLDLLKLPDISIGIHVIGNVFKKLKNLCSIALKNSKTKLGGVDKFVEIGKQQIHDCFRWKKSYARISHSDEANEVLAQVLQPEVTRTLTFACDQFPKSFNSAWGLTVHCRVHKRKKK
ncbi:unnamed protein product [Brachionus calyciflorus]|uniref:C2H2-type domain-containing protein n=1 Tax=Brachionus calyciflorus TaxID=104777 RepID=A0A814HK44_9BILA|nr:unnamed protein product [Brachionus calyciflorus]